VIKVIVGIGKKQRTFICYEKLLRQSSFFFNNALKSEWKEAQDRIVTMTETKPKTFGTYVKFLLTGLLFVLSDQPSSASNHQPSTPDTQSPAQDLQSAVSDLQSSTSNHRSSTVDNGRNRARARGVAAWANLLELASFLQAPDFQDAILDGAIESMLEVRRAGTESPIEVGGELVTRIYTFTIQGSPVRRWIVDLCLHTWDRTQYTGTDFEVYPKGFLQDLIQATGPYIRSRNTSENAADPLDISKSCTYHVHTSGGRLCYRKKYQYNTK
jgi:hypothetical protein